MKLLKTGVFMSDNKIRSTTVVAVKRNGHVAMAGDGQVTAGNTVMKGNARKVRKIYDGKIITYDAIGNPDTYKSGSGGSWDLSWEIGGIKHEKICSIIYFVALASLCV